MKMSGLKASSARTYVGPKPSVQILGTRGIPASHGGFETFAEQLSYFLVDRGWDVTVYCQEVGDGGVTVDYLDGIRRITIQTKDLSAGATIYFDWVSTRIAAKQNRLVLTLGYNTAAFCFLYRVARLKNLINMDGLEWTREKWSFPAKAWLYINERMGCLFGDHLIADHPQIARHLATRVDLKKITMIPYGAPRVDDISVTPLEQFGLQADNYGLVIARPEPENSILEIVSAWSRKQRGYPLVVLGRYVPEDIEYHEAVLEAASDEVMFVGPQYDADVVQSLRRHTRLYIHGHRVGGTNPSLVEALGAGSPTLCHANRFNAWVAGVGSLLFDDEDECAAALDEILHDHAAMIEGRISSHLRHQLNFELDEQLEKYEKLLLKWQPRTNAKRVADIKTGLEKNSIEFT